MTLTPNEQLAAELFAIDVTEHQMIVRHDQGLYRHLQFGRPHRAFDSWFQLVTAPGMLTITGCRGSWTFCRDPDMFTFFKAGGYRVNSRYYAEKLGADRGTADEYSKDILLANLIDPIDEWQADDEDRRQEYLEKTDRWRQDAALWDMSPLPRLTSRPAQPDKPVYSTDIRELVRDRDEDGELEYEDGARAFLRELERLGVVSDTWEWNLYEYKLDFLWSLHAICWGVRQYDMAVASGAHRQRTGPVAWDEPLPTVPPVAPAPAPERRSVLTPHPAGGLTYDSRGRRVDRRVMTVAVPGVS